MGDLSRWRLHSKWGGIRGFTCLPTALLFQCPSGAVSCFLRFYRPLYFSDGLRRPYLSLREERYGRKTRQRAPKPPFGIWLFIRGFGGETCGLFYVCARVQFTRFRPVRRRAGGVRFTRLRRKAKHHLFSAISLPKALLPPDSVVLLRVRRKRWHFKNNQLNL